MAIHSIVSVRDVEVSLLMLSQVNSWDNNASSTHLFGLHGVRPCSQGVGKGDAHGMKIHHRDINYMPVSAH